MKSMRPVFKTEVLIYHSKACLDGKILFGKITHHLNPETWKILVRGMLGNKDSTFLSGPLFTCY